MAFVFRDTKLYPVISKIGEMNSSIVGEYQKMYEEIPWTDRKRKQIFINDINLYNKIFKLTLSGTLDHFRTDEESINHWLERIHNIKDFDLEYSFYEWMLYCDKSYLTKKLSINYHELEFSPLNIVSVLYSRDSIFNDYYKNKKRFYKNVEFPDCLRIKQVDNSDLSLSKSELIIKVYGKKFKPRIKLIY